MQLLLTTHPGLEDLAFEECEARLGDLGVVARGPARIRGRVELSVAAPRAAVLQRARALRTVHHLLEPLHRGTLPDPPTVEAVQAIAAEAEAPFLATAASFRVRTKRLGVHPFASPAIEQAAGAVFFMRDRTPVSLDAPAEVIRVDVVDDAVLVARALTETPLSARPGRPFEQRVGLKANVAAAMVAMTGLDGPSRIGDPFCGSGTVLQEAGAAFPDAELWGNDWVERAVEGTRANLEHSGLQAHLSNRDARAVPELWPEQGFDAVISNPPFGVQIGKQINFYRFYGQLLNTMQRLLKPGGRLTLLIDRKATFDDAVRSDGGFERVRQVHVQLGQISPWLITLTRAAPV